MTTIHETVRSMMDGALKRDEWDELPMAFTLTQEAGEEPGLAMFAIADMHPAEFLENMEGRTSLVPAGEILGIGMIIESWGVKSPTEAEHKKIQRYMRQGGKLADLENLRVEIKMAISLDNSGFKSVSFERGDTEITELPDSLEGRVPDALQHAFDILKLRGYAANL